VVYFPSNKDKPDIEKTISANVARLSPVQCAPNRPEPANVERDKTNGRFLRIVVSALLNMCTDIFIYTISI
jgi:hypothetical protein